ncbi:MAG: PilZ domain-containing protein [Candidatus Xenobia bacterium]
MEWLQALKSALGGGRQKRELNEGRTSYRVSANLPATIVMPDASATVGTVVNFSGRGLMVVVPASFRRDSTVVVTVRGRQPLGARGPAPMLTVRARVIWCKRGRSGSDFEAGLEYLQFQDMRMTDVVDFFRRQLRLDLMDTAQKRKTLRIRRRFEMTVQVKDGAPKPGFVRDLTLTGVRFATRERLSEGLPVHLEIDLQDKQQTLSIDATVGRCDKIPKEDWYDVAVPFTLSDTDHERLERLMNTALD